MLRHAGLAAALAAHCTDSRVQQAIAVTCTAEGDFGAIDAEAALVPVPGCAGGAAQRRQARAEPATPTSGCCARRRRAELTIVDDGRGFDVAKARQSRKGLGLVSIKERVRLAGGTLSIVTELERAHRFACGFPTEPARRTIGD